MLTRPVFIIGAPRAGTSVLGRLLGAHPGLNLVVEPRFVWRYGNDHRSDILPASAARPHVARHISGYFDAQMAGVPHARLLEKHPSNALRVPFVERIFPDAHFIHITRNGYDAALSIERSWRNWTKGIGYHRHGTHQSILRQRLAEIRARQVPFYALEFCKRFIPRAPGVPRTLWGPRLPGMGQMVRDMGVLEVAALQWRMCTERARFDGARLGPERYFELKLEDLDAAMLQRILAFANLPDAPEIAKAFADEFDPAKPRRAPRAFDGLSADKAAVLSRVVGPANAWLGYDPALSSAEAAA